MKVQKIGVKAGCDMPGCGGRGGVFLLKDGEQALLDRAVRRLRSCDLRGDGQGDQAGRRGEGR